MKTMVHSSSRRNGRAASRGKLGRQQGKSDRLAPEEELQLACRLAECRRGILILAASTEECVLQLEQLRTKLALGRLRIQDVVELEGRPTEQVKGDFARWVEGARESLCASSEAPASDAPAGDALPTDALADHALKVATAGENVGSTPTPVLRPGVLERLISVDARGRLRVSSLPPQGKRQLRRLETEAMTIRDRFVSANQGLVAHIVQRYVGMGLNLEDLIQEGNIGLMRAIEKFDHRRGGRFVTYAVWWIRQGVRRALANQSRTIRIPVHALGSRYEIGQTARHLATQLGREATPEELAGATGLCATRVAHLLTLTKEPLSLDEPRGFEKDHCLGDRVADDSLVDGMQLLCEKQQTELVQTLVNSLGERARLMLRMRFGLDGSEEHTLEEIGAAFSLTRERVRQIVKAALLEARHRSDVASTVDYSSRPRKAPDTTSP
jgi:RNA polymerase sigma factor (sigma-70 family)